MLISHSQKFIFIKTQKTGGTSVEIALQPFCTPHGMPITHSCAPMESEFGVVGYRGPMGPGVEKPKWYNHMTATEIRDLVSEDVWARYAKILNVRNPFTRAISAFRFQRARQKIPESATLEQDKEEFRSFLKMQNKSYRALAFIGDEFVPTEIIRFESLADDLNLVAGRLNLPKSKIQLAHYKKYDGRFLTVPTHEYYDGPTRELVLHNEQWCFDRFHYSTDPRDA